MPRNATQSKLKQAQAALEQLSDAYIVNYKCCDVTDAQRTAQVFLDIESTFGPVDVLVCNAGSATPGYFHQQDLSVHERTMQLNFFGTLNAIHAAAPVMLSRGRGSVVAVSSSMGTLGFSGYASYAPSKYAVKGLVDCLRNEWASRGVDVSVAFPVDIDTPGHRVENQTKPDCCREISEAGGVCTPVQAAQAIVDGFANGLYHLPSTDFGNDLLAHATGGVVPKRLSLLQEWTIGPILAVALRAFRWWMDSVTAKHAGRQL